MRLGYVRWEFSFTIPSDSPVYDFSPNGWTKHTITATVVGSGSLLRQDLSDSKPCIVICEYIYTFCCVRDSG